MKCHLECFNNELIGFCLIKYIYYFFQYNIILNTFNTHKQTVGSTSQVHTSGHILGSNGGKYLQSCDTLTRNKSIGGIIEQQDPGPNEYFVFTTLVRQTPRHN